MSDVRGAQQLLCTISSDVIYDQRPSDEPDVIQLLEFMLKKEIHVTARVGAYSGDVIMCNHVMHYSSESTKAYIIATLTFETEKKTTQGWLEKANIEPIKLVKCTPYSLNFSSMEIYM